MASIVERWFLIRKGELGKVITAVLLIFFLAGTMIVMRSTSASLFLSQADVSFLPFLFVGVSVAMVLITAVCNRLFSRLPILKVIIFVNPFLAVTIIGLYILVLSGWKWAVWILYIYGSVAVSLAMMYGWILINDVYTSREAKRLFGFINIGGTLAGIISGFGMGVFTSRFSSEALIPVCAGGLLLAVGMAILLQRYAPAEQEVSSTTASANPVRVGHIYKKPYIRSIAFIAALTVFGVSFADYIFKMTAYQHYNGAELTAFFGKYFGISNSITLIYSILLSSRVVNWLGIRGMSLVLPFEFLSSVVLYGMHPGIAVASLFKFGATGINYTIHNVATQTLLLPLRHKVRAQVKSFLGGIVKPIATGIAGIFLYVLSLYVGIKTMLPYAYVLGGISIIWIFVTWSIRDGYITALYDSIKTRGLRLDDVLFDSTDSMLLHALEKELQSEDDNRVVYTLDLLEELSVPDISKYYHNFLRSSRLVIIEHILPKIEQLHSPEFSHDLLDIMERFPQLRGAAIRALAASGGHDIFNSIKPYTEDSHYRVDALVALWAYGTDDEREYARSYCVKCAYSDDIQLHIDISKVLAETGIDEISEDIIRILCNSSTESYRNILRGSAQSHDTKSIELLIEGLFNPLTQRTSIRYLKQHTLSKQYLIEASQKRKTDQELQIVAEALGTIGGKRIVQSLWDILRNDLPLTVRYSAIKSLGRLSRASDTGIKRKAVWTCIQREIKELYMISRVEESDSAKKDFRVSLLLRSAREERLELIIELLGMEYGHSEMDAVLSALQQKNNIANAIELLDSRVTHPDKAYLITYLEQEHPGQEYARFFTVEHSHIPECLLECNDNLLHALVAFLQDNHTTETKSNISELYRKKENTMLTMIERVLALKSAEIFRKVSGRLLMFLAESAKEQEYEPDDIICKEGDTDRSLFIIVQGEVDILKEQHQVATLGPSDCIGEMSLLDGEPRSATARVKSPTVCLIIEQDFFYDVVSQNIDIAKGVFNVLSGRIRSMLEQTNV